MIRVAGLWHQVRPLAGKLAEGPGMRERLVGWVLAELGRRVSCVIVAALAAVLTAGTACGSPGDSASDAAPADALLVDSYAGPTEHVLWISASRDLPGFLDAGVSLTINGEPVEDADGVFESRHVLLDYGEPDGVVYTVETWLGDALLFRLVDRPGVCALSCYGFPEDEAPVMEWMSWCITSSGALHFVSSSCEYVTPASCEGDSQCAWPCDPYAASACGDGEKCGLVVTNETPLYGFFGCVPEGEVPLGQSCNRGPPGPSTGHDDCAEGGVCWEGACRRPCTEYHECPDEAPCTLFPRLDGRAGWCP